MGVILKQWDSWDSGIERSSSQQHLAATPTTEVYPAVRLSHYFAPMNSTGHLQAIWLKRARGGPMDPQDAVELVAGSGLKGNADQGRSRQVTLVDVESWAEVEERLGRSVDPTARRANLLVSGVRLTESRGQVLRIGSCRIRILGETRPCRQMEETETGLSRALAQDWGGGAYGEVLDDGEIAVGDEVRWENDGLTPPNA